MSHHVNAVSYTHLDYTVAGFTAMTALATDYNDAPEKASRPFDKDRSGFVIGEGAGIVVIESLANAIRRGARIYAEILGHASSSDGYHVAALDPSAAGAVRSMKSVSYTHLFRLDGFIGGIQ